MPVIRKNQLSKVVSKKSKVATTEHRPCKVLKFFDVVTKIDVLFFGIIVCITILWCYIKNMANHIRLNIKYFVWFYAGSAALFLCYAIISVVYRAGRGLLFVETGLMTAAMFLFLLWIVGIDDAQNIEYQQNRLINYVYPILGIFIVLMNSSINSMIFSSINDMNGFVIGSSLVLVLFSIFVLCSIAPKLDSAFGSDEMVHSMIGLSAIIPAMYFGRTNGWLYYVFGVVMFALNSNLFTDKNGYYFNLSKIIAGASGLMLGTAAICFILITDVAQAKLPILDMWQ